MERALELLGGSTDFDESIAGADLVVESGPEDLAWKQELFARMDSLARPEAVLASNTSGLSITAIASRCSAAGARGDDALLESAAPHAAGGNRAGRAGRRQRWYATIRDLLTGCGKTPVVVRKDRPGQLGNRLQMALVREAANIVAEGIADAEDVDTVVRNGFGIRMPAYGIFEHMDVAGLDLGLRVLEYVAPDLYNEPRAPEYFRDLVRQGHLGARTGRGFYDWSANRADAVRARRDAFLVEVLRYRKESRAKVSRRSIR